MGVAEEFANEMRDWFLENAEQILIAAKHNYDNGVQGVLIRIVALCIFHGVEIPTWARKAFCDAVKTNPPSWDDVFGRPLPKGKSHIAALRRERLNIEVFLWIEEMRAGGNPADDSLFAAVGKKLGASAATVRNVYYNKQAREWFDELKASPVIARTMIQEIGRDASNEGRAAWLRQNLSRFIAYPQYPQRPLRSNQKI